MLPGPEVVDKPIQELLPSATQLQKMSDSLRDVFFTRRYRISISFHLNSDREANRPSLPTYFLSPDELGQLRSRQGPAGAGKGYYEVDVQIPAPGRDQDESSSFDGMCDVRISQARVWLFGASVVMDPNMKNYELKISLTQFSTETIVDTEDLPHLFQHVAILLSFSYDPNTAYRL
jgi:hypothetical protein